MTIFCLQLDFRELIYPYYYYSACSRNMFMQIHILQLCKYTYYNYANTKMLSYERDYTHIILYDM